MAGATLLARLLKSRFISRQAIASDLGVSVQTVDNWCIRRVDIPLAKLQLLAESLRRHGAPSADVMRVVLEEVEAQGLRELTPMSRRSPDETLMVVAWDLAGSGASGPVSRLCRLALERMGYQCLVIDCGRDHRLKRGYLQQAPSLGCRGVVLAGVEGDLPDPDGELAAAIEPLVKDLIPVVIVKPWTGLHTLPPGAAGIGWDASAVVDMAVGVLMEAGHTRVGAVQVSPWSAYGPHYGGLDRAVERRGCTLDPELVGWPPEEGSSLAGLMKVVSQATGLFTAPSNLGYLAQACHEAGLAWPESISIVTVGDERYLPRLGPRPFTHVALPLDDIASGAAQLLVRMVRSEESTQAPFVLYGPSAMTVQRVEDGSVGEPRVRAT